MSQEFDCHYGEAEFNAIKAGIEAIEEVFHLLEAYTEGPYEILLKNIDNVPEEYKPKALYLLNPNNW